MRSRAVRRAGGKAPWSRARSAAGRRLWLAPLLSAAAGSVATAAPLAAASPLWTFDAGAAAWALAGGGAYWLLARTLPRPPAWAQVLSFVSGLAAVVVALSSPLDTMGETVLLTMHMLEHMALTLIGALFIVLGVPRGMLERARRLPVLGFILDRFWSAAGMVLYSVVVVLWHVPVLYEAALRHEAIHDFEHLCFLLFGLLFWGPVVKPITPGRGRSGAPFRRLVGVLVALGVNTVLGSYLFFAQHVLYPTYVTAPRVWGLIDPLTDQSIAGGSLWVMGDMAYIIAAVVLVAEWLQGVGAAAAPRTTE
ncbi:MAG TPA: cytochrome c oxidase assembly protein [Trueperaceae bacterium]|nr:cytochrome c oxidase assembly protein [Trueperaceae bacterium]